MVRTPVMLLIVTSLAACGGGVAQSTADAGGPGGLDAAGGDEPTVHTSFLTLLHFGADECLPVTLPVDARGEVPCTIFVLPATAASCDPSLGLSAVDPGVAATVRAAAQAPASEIVCQLAQLPESAWVNGSCAGASAAGWCYVAGPAAGGGCPQALRFSVSGTPGAGDEVLLGCQ